jgi:predicted ATPase
LDVDVLVFEHCCANGQREAAIAAYTDDLFIASDDREICRERAQLARRFAEVLERSISHARLAGKTSDAATYARRLQAADPYCERTIRTLMQLERDAGERTTALRMYREFERLIESELGVKPESATTALYARLCAEDAGSPPQSTLPPERTTFFGRARDMAHIVADLERRQSITITGPPGIGKTRLATRIARLLESEFVGAVLFIDLSAATSPGDVETLVFEAVIAKRAMLVILDRCEHVVRECTEVIERIALASPSTKILVTSRRSLRVAGEAQWRLSGLSLPGEDTDDPRAESTAEQLFLDRALRLRPRSTEDPPPETVASICRLLDGVPLALELAASQLRLTTYAELEALLRSRRRTYLENAYSWSYALLSPSAQRLFRMLAIFSGGFAIEAACEVCEELAPDTALAALEELVDHSMIVADSPQDDVSRYKLLYSAHAFARSKLDTCGESERARAAHTRYFIALADSLGGHLLDARRERTFPLLRCDADNIVAALGEAIFRARDVQGGLRATLALGTFWTDALLNRAGLALIEAALRLTSVSSPLVAPALRLASILARQSGDVDRAVDYADSACRAFADAKDPRGESRALVALGTAHMIVKRFDRVVSAGERALELAQAAGSFESELFAVFMIATAKLSVGEIREARKGFARGVEIANEIGMVREALIGLNNLAMCALLADELDDARDYARAALVQGRALALPENEAWALSALASVAWRAHDVASGLEVGRDVVEIARKTDSVILEIRLLEDIAAYLVDADDGRVAASLLGAVDSARKRFDQPLQPIEEPQRRRLWDRIVERFGSSAVETARAIGSTWSLEYAMHDAFAHASTTRLR